MAETDPGKTKPAQPAKVACSECLFFQKSAAALNMGFCHLDPANHLVVHPQTRQPKFGHPLVDAADWCSRFQERPL